LASALTAGALVMSVANEVYAQYTPPPPPQPFPGFINSALRQENPYAANWDIGGAVRLRYEINDGKGVPGSAGSLDFRDHGADNENDYLLYRVRARVGYTSKWWGALVEGRSSAASSDERVAFAGPPVFVGDGPESDTIDLHQAYFTLGNHKEFPVSLKVGRQELSYAEERLVGAFAWNNIGRVFDAAKVRWQNAWFGADFFTSRIVIPEDQKFNVSNDYDLFSGVYATSPKIPKHSLDVFFLARNASAQAASAEPRSQVPLPSARDIYTGGFRLKSSPGAFGNWDYALDLMAQLGSFKDTRAGAPTTRLDQEAFAAVLQGGYTFADTWATPRLGLEYAYGSGDSDPTDGTRGTFENLFPTNHKFYGYSDFVSLQNIHNVRLNLTGKPHPRVSAALEGHLFWLADTSDNFYNVGGGARGGTTATPGTGYGINPNYDSFVGSEINLVVGVALTKYAQAEAGFGHFFAGDYIESSLSAPTHGARDANFAYAQINFNF